MINIICEVSKYLVLLFMVLYTVKCFSVLSSKNEEQKRKKLNKQIGYLVRFTIENEQQVRRILQILSGKSYDSYEKTGGHLYRGVL